MHLPIIIESVKYTLIIIWNQHKRCLYHQFGHFLFNFLFIKNFLAYSQTNKRIEKRSPGHNKKKGRGLPPNTLFTPGQYNINVNKHPENIIPDIIVKLKPE